MLKSNELDYDIEGTKINPYVIQVAFDAAKNHNRENEVLENTF